MEGKEVFKKKFEIHTYDTDVTQHLSFTGLADYLQDIASYHADRLGLGHDNLQGENITWVLRQLKVEIQARARWNDWVTIETWPKMPDRLFAFRDFRVADGSGNPVAKAASTWLLINLETRRPVRMNPEMFESYDFKKEDVFAEGLRTLPEVKPGRKLYETIVRFSHLDMNRHVNNVVFIRWIMDAFYMNHPHDGFPEIFEIQYDHEVFLGDAIAVYETITATGEIFYSVMRMKDETRVALAKIVF